MGRSLKTESKRGGTGILFVVSIAWHELMRYCSILDANPARHPHLRALQLLCGCDTPSTWRTGCLLFVCMSVNKSYGACVFLPTAQRLTRTPFRRYPSLTSNRTSGSTVLSQVLTADVRDGEERSSASLGVLICSLFQATMVNRGLRNPQLSLKAEFLQCFSKPLPEERNKSRGCLRPAQPI